VRSFIIFSPIETGQQSVYQPKEDWMGSKCGTYAREQRFILGFGVETLKKRYNFEEPGVQGRIILKWIFRK